MSDQNLDPLDPATYSDAQLLETLEEAKRDLTQAARDELESEWHQGCFAAVILLAREASARGLVKSTIH